MDKRVALIGIIIEKYKSAQKVNSVLHEYGDYIIGRMGIPYREREISIISVALDAPSNIISALSGKIGMIDGAYTKTIYSKTSKEESHETFNRKT
ncbi:MAG: iron-only hydrogenase system regulator [Ruminococcaceae bacterium]|nr:iron-only hydrogenase system regulator [Oscillospiraceae bacterium]